MSKTIQADEVVKNVTTLTGDALEQYLNKVTIDRLAFEQQLLVKLATDQPVEKKFAIIFVLGEYRMERAVPYLSSIITLENENLSVNSREPLIGAYPVVEALARIGTPAAPEMLKNIETSDNETVRGLSLRVLKGVYGAELARCYLQIALEKQHDPIIKGRISRTMEKLPAE